MNPYGILVVLHLLSIMALFMKTDEFRKKWGMNINMKLNSRFL